MPLYQRHATLAANTYTGTQTFADGSTWTSSGITMASGKTIAAQAVTATTLALGGATIGAHALAVTGSVNVSTSITAGSTITAAAASGFYLGAAKLLDYDGTFTRLLSNAGVLTIRVGASQLSYNSTEHQFNNAAFNATFATLNASALTLGTSVYFAGTEMTAPAAPSANGWRIYAVDNGGKTELLALFASGAAQRIAIEP